LARRLLLVWISIIFATEANRKDMEPIIITPKSEQEYSLVMELLKKMRIKATPYHEMIDESIVAVREGRTIPHREVIEMLNEQINSIPGVAGTYEELADELKLVEAKHNPVACISHAEAAKRLGSRISVWK
jgi:predicted Rossmann-fold nucleotide-binding protein